MCSAERLGLVLGYLVLASCAPATDLTNIPAGGGAASPGGPAGAALVDPAAGSGDVPLNLAAVVVRFAAPIAWGPDGLRVCEGPAGPVPTAPPIEVSCDGGACYRVDLAGGLPPAVSCRVSLGGGARDPDGVPIQAGVIGVFDTGEAADETPPLLGEISVGLAGPCLEVSFATDEPASATVLVLAAGMEVARPAGAGKTRFEVAIALGSLVSSAGATVTVSATDRAGNATASPPVAFETPPALPALAITEVLANPAGPEPAQEYVELQNLGDVPVSLAGLTLADAKAADPLPAETVGPGAHVLVVSSGYDPQQGQDAPPRIGTPIVRIDARLGSDGLSNAGEPVRLLLGNAIVSSYGGWIDVSAGSWAGRAVHRLVAAACDRADAWNHMPLEPSPGAGPP